MWAANGNQDDFTVVSDKNADQMMEQSFKALYADKGCSNASNAYTWDYLKNMGSGKKPDNGAKTQPCNSVGPAVMASGLAAWNNSGLVYDYFQTTHNRNSVDGKGMMIRSIVNFGGSGFQNAAWFNDKKVMLYGMGDEKEFNDFASSIDVVGHEITHGITASTAALQYVSESGALNESYSDVFGKLVAFRSGKLLSA